MKIQTHDYKNILYSVIITLLLSKCFIYAETTPFNGFTPGLPATIEFEQFDNGSNGYAYYDNTPTTNSGGKYRNAELGNQGVDIFRCADYGGMRGYCVGDTSVSEWLLYSITNTETASYKIEVSARIAPGALNSMSPTWFHFELDDIPVTDQLYLPCNTYAWQTICGTATIPEGSHKLKFYIDDCDPTYGAGLFDYMTIYKTPIIISNTSPTITVTGLSTNNNATSANNNTTILQTILDNMSNNGGTVIIPSGKYYFRQANPIETFPVTSSAANLNASLVTSMSGFSGRLRNDFTGWVGFQFQVGNSPLRVTSLGRWIVAGNSQAHQIKLLDSNGNEIANALLQTSGQTSGQFAYANLSNPVILNTNTIYAIVSKENAGYGNDQWYDNIGTYVQLNDVAVNAWGVYASSLPPYTLAAYSQGQSYGPVSLQYSAYAAQPFHNYAVKVEKSNITIKGANQTNATTMVAYNRDTTLLFIGTGQGLSIYGLNSVSNIILNNITFEGSPTIDYSGSYNTNGIARADQIGWVTLSPIGSLVVFGGDPSVNNYSSGLVVDNCTFNNPSTIGLLLHTCKDVYVNNTKIYYFNGITPALATNLGAWCGILSQGEPVENIVVENCIYNGNVSMQSGFDYSSDGFIWLANGGKWVVKNCAITNSSLEAVALNAGPYTVVGNKYNTMSLNPCSCALWTFHNSNTQLLSSSVSKYSSYSFINNTVKGGTTAIITPSPANPNAATAPFCMLVSANNIDLGPVITNGVIVTGGIGMSMAQNVTLSGNIFTNTSISTGYSIGSATPKTNLYLLALCNDFSTVTHTSLQVQDGSNKYRNSRFYANKIGRGYWAHMLFEFNNQIIPATNVIKGNSWYYWGQVTTNYVITVNNGVCESNDRSEYADTNIFSLY